MPTLIREHTCTGPTIQRDHPNLPAPPRRSADIGKALSPLRLARFRAVLEDYPLEAWATEVLDYVEYGFTCRPDIPPDVLARLPRAPLAPLPMSPTIRTDVRAYIQAEVERGRTAGPFSSYPTDAVFHRVGGIPGKPGKAARCIADLSATNGRANGLSVNDVCPAPAFKAASFSKLWHFLKHNGWREEIWLGLRDVESAYRHVALHPDIAYLFWYEFDGAYYNNTCCSFGWTPSGYAWDLIGQVLDWARSRERGCDAASYRLLLQVDGESRDAGSSRYVDDVTVVAFTKDACNDHLAHCDYSMDFLGAPVAHSKNIQACTRMISLGIGIDTIQKIVFLGRDKAAKIIATAADFLRQGHVSPKNMEKLIGKLRAASAVIPAAAHATHLLGVHARVNKIGAHASTTNLPISEGAKSELRWWIRIMRTQDGITESAALSSQEPTFVRSYARPRCPLQLHWTTRPYGYLWAWTRDGITLPDGTIRDLETNELEVDAFGTGHWGAAGLGPTAAESLRVFTRVIAWAAIQLSPGSTLIVHCDETNPKVAWHAIRGRTPPSYRGRPGSTQRDEDNARRAAFSSAAMGIWHTVTAQSISLQPGQTVATPGVTPDTTEDEATVHDIIMHSRRPPRGTRTRIALRHLPIPAAPHT